MLDVSRASLAPYSQAMELAASPHPYTRSLRAAVRFDARAAGAWTLGFAPILYLALRGGGYDLIVRSEVGLAAWWVLLLGVIAGVLPVSRIGGLGWVCAGLLGAFALWTGIAIGWSPSAERSMTELGRIVTYVGFLALGLCVLRRDNIRQLVTGMATAFGIVSVLAVLSRLYPSWFAHDQVASFFPGSTSRLNYPLNYANGTGNLLAIGLPLLLATATRARTVVSQAVAAACLPVTVLGIVLTASRGAVLTAVVGIVVFFALAPDRLPKLANAVVAAAGSAIVVDGVLQRSALRDGLSTPLAVTQRHQLTVLLVVVCAGVALLQVGIALAARYAVRPRALRIGRRQAAYGTLAGLLVVIVVAIAAGVPGQLANQWRAFKQTDVTGVVSSNVYSRLASPSGSHRYQYWSAAALAYRSKPLTGIGPGTFEFYWAQHGSIYEFVRNAHSLYLETLAETGLVGLALIVALIVALFAAGVARALLAPPLARASLAAATGSLAAFCAAAGYDWMWQLAVAPVVALLLGAAILVYRDPASPREASHGLRRRAWPLRMAVVALAIIAIVAIAIPYGMTSEIRASQSAARAGHLKAALGDAATAQRVEPYAATPRLQRALILEASGDLEGAQTAAAQAAEREPDNWRIWLLRARIDAESGHAIAAVRDYRRAHALNPRSPATSL
jgi:hypothetical protein